MREVPAKRAHIPASLKNQKGKKKTKKELDNC